MVRFRLYRNTDISGVSGTGWVAEGCIFQNHRCCLSWLSTTPAVTLYDDIEDLMKVHGHGGATEIVYLDPVEPVTCATPNA